MADIDDTCADCGGDKAHMHNSREVRAGIWPMRKTQTRRFPGFICHDCWKAANPVLWAGTERKPRKLAPFWIVGTWLALFAFAVAQIVAIARML